MMDNEEKAQFGLKILRGSLGDDLERAQLAFGNLSDSDIDKQYGQSGRTCREILDGYRQDRARRQETIDFFADLAAKYLPPF